MAVIPAVAMIEIALRTIAGGGYPGAYGYACAALTLSAVIACAAIVGLRRGGILNGVATIIGMVWILTQAPRWLEQAYPLMNTAPEPLGAILALTLSVGLPSSVCVSAGLTPFYHAGRDWFGPRPQRRRQRIISGRPPSPERPSQ